MEGDSIMKRLTSFLVPSFVSNALTPGRRDGPSPNTASQHDGNHVTSNNHGQNRPSEEGQGQQQQQSTVASLPVAANLGKPQRQSSPTEADSQQKPKRRRGLGGAPAVDDVIAVGGPSSGNPAGHLWSSTSASFSNPNASIGGSKRRCVLDDEFSGLSSAAKRSRTMLASPTQPLHHQHHYSASSSLFYAGRTGYGGGYSAQVPGRSVRVTPMQLEPLCDGFTGQQQQQQLVTPTAKKILDSLDRLSTPLVDARRMPQSSTSTFSTAASVDATGLAAPAAAAFTAPYRVAYRRRFQTAAASGGTPPTRGQQQQPASASIAVDSFRSRDLIVPPTAAVNHLSRPQLIEDKTALSAMEFQFSVPIYRGSHQPNKPSVGNSWQCLDCMVTNAPGTTACKCCSVANKRAPATGAKPTSAATTAAAAVASSASATSATDWRCNTCMCTSPASSQVCVVCQEKRPAPIGATSNGTSDSVTIVKPSKAANNAEGSTVGGDWRCNTCMCTSPASSQVCVVCQEKRLGAVAAAPATTTTTAVTTAAANAAQSASGEWRCDTCMCTSPASSQVCVVCQEKRPGASASASLAPSGGMTKRPSFIDRGPATAPIFSMFSQQQQQQQNQATTVSKWQCDTCLVENVASVSRCVACESPKPGAVVSKVSFGAPSISAVSSDSGPKISFGAPSTGEAAASGQGFSFGGQSSASSNSSESATKIIFGAPDANDTGQRIAFGAASTSTASDPATKISFGASSAATTGASLPSFTFGAPTSVASGNTATKTSFGVPSVGSDAGMKTTFGIPSTEGDAGTKTSFGIPPTSSDSGTKTLFGIASAGSDSGTKTAFGAIPSAGSDAGTKTAFGIPPTKSDVATKTTFGIPSDGINAVTTTTFGAIPSAGSAAGTKTAFGVIPSSGSATDTKTAFGIPSSGSDAGTRSSFGASASSDAGAKFVFGAASSASSSEPVPNVAFGAISSDSTLKFGLGASASTNLSTAQLGAEPAAQKRSFGALSAAPSGEGQLAKPSFGSLGSFGSSVPSFSAPSAAPTPGSATCSFGTQLPPASQPDQSGVAAKQAKFNFNFAPAAHNGSGAAGSLFGASNGAAPVVDLDAEPKPLQPLSFVFGSSAPTGGQSAIVFSARPQLSAPTEMGNNPLMQQQQQQQTLFAGQGNGPTDTSNPFNAQLSANRQGRSRIMARRRLGPK